MAINILYDWRIPGVTCREQAATAMAAAENGLISRPAEASDWARRVTRRGGRDDMSSSSSYKPGATAPGRVRSSICGSRQNPRPRRSSGRWHVERRIQQSQGVPKATRRATTTTVTVYFKCIYNRRRSRWRVGAMHLRMARRRNEPKPEPPSPLE